MCRWPASAGAGDRQWVDVAADASGVVSYGWWVRDVYGWWVRDVRWFSRPSVKGWPSEPMPDCGGRMAWSLYTSWV